MIVLYVLLAILGLLLLLLLIPVQIGLQYTEDLSVWVRYGLVKIRLYPVKSKPSSKPAPRKATAKTAAQKPKKKSSTADKLSEIAENMKRDSLSEMLAEVQALLQLIKRTTVHLLRAVTIDRLWVSVVVATGEADTTAMRYGQACAVLSPAAVMLHETMRVKQERIEVTPGFGMDNSRVAADIRVRIRPLRVIAVALGALIGFIQWTNQTVTSADEKG